MENILAEQEDIIIKCDLEEITKAFFKDYEIIWHDPNVNSEENQQYMAQLEKFCQIKTFTEWKEAEDYIKAAKTVCHVITSGTNGELLVKEIFSSQNVPKIFTFCRNEGYHSSWAKNYDKVLCTETKIEDVISQIQKNLVEWQKQTSSLKFNLPAFAPIFDDSDKSQMNHLHFYLKVIPNFHNRVQAKEDLVTLSRGVYSDKKNEKFIADFEQSYNDYKMEDTLRWYTQPSFLYKMINNCLRIATSDSIQWSRFLLKEIDRAIKDQYQTKSKNFSGLLYRAAYLSEEEWSSLRENVNREIEMHGFLSVSKDKKVALDFMGVNPTSKVFIIIIVPKGPIEDEQGFAEVEEFSKFPKEKEILFNVRSRFTVLETEDEYSPDMPSRHLVLLYGAQGLRKYITEENPVRQVSFEDLENILCSRCQVPTGEMAEKWFFMSFRDREEQIYFCRNCLEEKSGPFLCIPVSEIGSAKEIKGCFLMSPSQMKIPFYGYKCSQCGTKNQTRYFVCTDCGEREKKWCESCFDKGLSCVERGHAIILENYPFSFWCEKMSENELNHLKFQNYLVKKRTHIFQQVEMYLETHEYQKAIEHCNLYIEQNESKGKDDKLGSSYQCAGEAYAKQGEYQKALEFYLKTLEIYKSIHGEKHTGVATCYDEIGLLYQSQGEYQKALEYNLKSLDIRKSLHGENHHDVAVSYNNIGNIDQSQGEYKKALEHYFKSRDIYKLIHGESHPSVAISDSNIGFTYFRKGEYDKALEYHLKSLNIKKSIHGENHPSVAASYGNIGIVYCRQGAYNKALEYHLKSLNIKKTINGENHPSVATSYDNIGMIYHNQGEYQRALEYYLKSLGMFKSIHGENHPLVATSYDHIGLVYRRQGAYDKALEHHLKSLDIAKSIHGENHPSVSASYNNIGMIYESQGEYDKALEYHLKSLEIDKSVNDENHPSVAASYNNIGMIYESQGEYDKALEYYFKSLNIDKSVNGENHPSVAISYHNIGEVYDNQGEDKKALEYYWKSLNVDKLLYGENDPNLVLSYLRIGMIYEDLKEYKQALECYVKSLDIRKLVNEEDDPQLAALQDKIGKVNSLAQNATFNS